MRGLAAWMLVFGVVVCGCKDPQSVYFAEIEKSGFIPFNQPMGNVRSGTLVRGNPSQLFPMAPATRCLPLEINGKSSDLRWETDATLPETHYNATIAFNAKLNSIVATGTPLFTFKFEMTKVRQVDFAVDGVTIEMVDQIAFRNFFRNGMDEDCRSYLTNYPFVVDALFAKQMSFVFLDSNNGKIEIDAEKLQQIIDFNLNVNWHIENNYRLVITTPKYIGYHLAQLRAQDDGLIHSVAYEVDRKLDQFIWADLGF